MPRLRSIPLCRAGDRTPGTFTRHPRGALEPPEGVANRPGSALQLGGFLSAARTDALRDPIEFPPEFPLTFFGPVLHFPVKIPP